MANKYAELNAKAILLNDRQSQLLPVSKAKLIELANDQKGKFGDNVVDVASALTYLLGQDATNLEAAKTYTGTSINGLNSTITASNGYVLTGITEVAGKLTSYTQTWLDASVVTYNGGDNVKNVDKALTDIYSKLAAISGSGTGSIKDQINAAINGLDVTKIKEDGKAIVSVSETDGKIAATAGNIKAEYVDVDNTSNKFEISGNSPATTLTTQATLEHLHGKIKAVENAAAKYSIDKVTTDVPEAVAHRYKLTQTINGKSSQAGAVIDIPKDRSLKEVYLGTANDTVDETSGEVTKKQDTDAQSLNFVYHLETGKYKLVSVDVSKFLSESEFKNGLSVDNHTVSVKLATDSEKFLTVDANGVKLSGVQTAIDTAKKAATDHADSLIAALDSSVGDAYVEGNIAQVITKVTQEDGKLKEISSVALDDAHVKTTSFSNEDLATLLGNENLPSNLHEALNKIAGKVSEGATNAVTNVVGDEDNTYVNIAVSKTDNNNTVKLTVNDAALGNVAKLHYDVLASDVESVTILGTNPTV